MGGGDDPVAYADVYGSTQTPAASSDYDWTRGEKQENKCRDVAFAIFFYLQLIVVIVIACVYGPNAVEHTVAIATTNSTSVSDSAAVSASEAADAVAGYLYAILATGVFAMVLSALFLYVMMWIPTILVQTALIFVTLLSGAWAVAAAIMGSWIGALIGFIFFALGICYACLVWSRIPFAAANLETATTGIQANCGITLYAFLAVVLGYIWSLVWMLATIGVWDVTSTCNYNTKTGEEECVTSATWAIVLLLVSYFFGHQVLHNTVHVINAGVMGTWWFTPEEANSCCSRAIWDSTVRAVTTSFGSICFGSLLVAIVQTLRELAYQANKGDGNIFAAIAECLLACLESVLRYFNKWAYIYVGLYGYGYLEAGKNVFALFRNRGWDAIIADDLVSKTLLLVCLVIALCSGGAGVLFAVLLNIFPGSNHQVNLLICFGFGFLVGVVLSSIFMGTVASAVNATIVLFAEAPSEFQTNYPELSEKMRAAWLEAYPGCL